ncbi:MAG: zf-HC2 domain-containing protein [Spirochaetaceae bacterium]|nr:zf-HC2 domain-containing protein [Spirochaetaceae bacterium]
MCPDDSLLSAYVDGEVPSPWKEKMESHIGECPACTKRIVTFRMLDKDIQALETISLGQSFAAASKRIAADLDFDHAVAKPSGSAGKSPDMVAIGGKGRLMKAMSRRVSIPAPLLAASFLVIVFLAGILLGGKVLSAGKAQTMASASGTIAAGADSMESINKYWSSQNSTQGITITMPSEVSFEPLGDPVIMTYEEPAATVPVTDGSQGGAKP